MIPWEQGGASAAVGEQSSDDKDESASVRETLGQLQLGSATNHGQYYSNDKVEKVSSITEAMPSDVNRLPNHALMINDVNVLSNPNVCTQQKSNIHLVMGVDLPQQV